MSTKRKAPSKIAAPAVRQSARLPTKTSVNEKNAHVTTSDTLQAAGALAEPETIDISSDSSESFSDEEGAEDEEMQDADANDDVDDDAAAEPKANSRKAVNGAPARQDAEADATDGTDSDADAAPTFGDLLREQETIDVSAALGQPSSSNALVTHGSSTTRALAAPSASSLGTVLNQALRTDDAELLESCFGITEKSVVQNTIERLDSALAGSLLGHIATRLHRRPGRAGTLMNWVQWTLVVHGGALAGQPEALAKLAKLQKVLAVRARGLNSLLILKGKLDLLDSQLKLRKKMQARHTRGFGTEEDGDADEEDDEHVIYVEGEETDAAASRRIGDVEDDDDIDDMLLTNGIGGDSDDEEDDVEEYDDDSEGDDDVAGDEDEVNFDDVDDSMGEDDESDVEGLPPAKVQKVKGAFAKGRK